ncbi:MAG: helix-turn-helix domain-containing protein [Chloroflexi bacterium]|nr:helix-turn-helix domain-containing protein [Chloroflexota bacterium]
MNYDDYIAKREARDSDFKEACERLRPQFEFRKSLIGARLAAGLTQKQLAERVGTSQAAIARLESGAQLPSVNTLYRLAVVLGLQFTIAPGDFLSVSKHRAA